MEKEYVACDGEETHSFVVPVYTHELTVSYPEKEIVVVFVLEIEIPSLEVKTSRVVPCDRP